MTDIFISYAKEENRKNGTAARLSGILKDQGYTVWWDSDLGGGQDYRRVIRQKLDEAKVVIVLWTEESVASQWVCAEAEVALTLKKLISVRTPSLPPSDLPLPFNALHADVFAGDAGTIIEAVRQRGIVPVQSSSKSFGYEPYLDLGEDPLEVFSRWYVEAAEKEATEPNVMTLATVDDMGVPAVRTMYLTALASSEDENAKGFVFYSDARSAKGRQLARSSNAAVSFHWKSLGRQVLARGAVEELSASEADGHFASRPRGAKIGAWSMPQSSVVTGADEVERAIAVATERFSLGEIPRPSDYKGYRLVPFEIEFWKERPFRLYERVFFKRRSETDDWTGVYLAP